ncbi:MAG: hypothetical protein ACLFVJ_20750 [Persicimonas sp.]
MLAHARCGRCAERVSRTAILQEAECEHCGSALAVEGGDILGDLQARRLKWRLFGYLLVALASFAAGFVPLLQVGVQLVALFVLHVIVLRRGLKWLAPGRRILTRMSIKLLGAALATIALLINVAIAPLVGASAFILAAAGPLLTALYVESGLVILRRRLRRQADDRPIGFLEWALPVSILVLLLGAIAATAGVVAATVHLLSTLEVPGISELAAWLLEVAP